MINRFGTDISYQSTSGTSMNKYGDNYGFTWATATTAKAIVDSPREDSLTWETEGGVKTGRLYFYMENDESISSGDRITYQSTYYIVDEVLKYQFLNKYTCQRVNAYRDLSQ